MSAAKSAEAEEYHCNDFEWETLKEEIENNPSLLYHCRPFDPSEHSTTADNQDSSKAWQKFHLQHSSGKFFKERRYLLKEFPELVSGREGCKVLEVGCGNGSTALPILRGNKGTILYACDCSKEVLEKATECVKAKFWVSNPSLASGISDCCQTHSDGFCASATQESTSCIGGVDFVTLIFTLSAVPLERMPSAISACFSVLKPGGMLLFRDYGLYDMSMLRFEPHQRVGFREYMRSDGTRSYFFCLDTLKNLCTNAGFIEREVQYCCVKSVNRRNGKIMRRVWVHGKFQKP